MRIIPTMLAPVTMLAITACGSPPVQENTAEATAAEVMPEGPSNAVPVADAADGFLAQHFADDGEVSVATTAIDLNGDGMDEIVAYASGPMLCGSGGCNVLVLEPAGEGFTVRMDASVSKLPVTVLDSSSHGWRDLTVWVGGGGGESGNAVLRFDGIRYPSNPTVPPAILQEEQGTVLIAQDAWDSMRRLGAPES
ncbi:hypothetical protein [Croceicoccus sp. Ery5]|uniref:hypothetical protein n=1 Tax=Croceicoccus sp. Ery5 TaxID=1703340 RepID=UPI001E2FFBF5|nr:hypothetical protein [Croceicoccus sp. Ery5]